MSITSESSWLDSAFAAPTPATSPAAQEALHDGRQSVATILALLAAGSRTVDDPQQTLTRLRQIESELLDLWSMLQRGGSDRADALVEVDREVCELVDVLVLEFAGCIDVVADSEARISVRRTDLRRIMGNLLRNAMRAAGAQGNIAVTVTADADEVTILVDDDGPGFGSLAVVHGVGLRGVGRLVEQAGGTTSIRARGRLGGASIEVRLPITGTGSAA